MGRALKASARRGTVARWVPGSSFDARFLLVMVFDVREQYAAMPSHCVRRS